MQYTEIAVQFGAHGRLNGVLTVPPNAERVSTVLILISAGFTAKCGPYRLYSETARSLAAAGAATLRFDLGGIGNSEILDPGAELEERTRLDISDAVELVARKVNPDNIIVGGLCSGAEDGFRFAKDDERISGVLLIDAHAYRTWHWWHRNFLSQFFVSKVVYKLLRVFHIVNLPKTEPQDSRPEGFEGDLVDYKYMEMDEVKPILRQLNGRGVRYHYIYTAGRIEIFNHVRQFYRMFTDIDFCGYETVTHLPQIGHVQVFQEDREMLVAVIVKWIRQEFCVD